MDFNQKSPTTGGLLAKQWLQFVSFGHESFKYPSQATGHSTGVVKSKQEVTFNENVPHDIDTSIKIPACNQT